MKCAVKNGQNVTKFDIQHYIKESSSVWLSGTKTKTRLLLLPWPDGACEEDRGWEPVRCLKVNTGGNVCVYGGGLGGWKGNSCQRSLPLVITVHRGQRKCNFYTQALNRTDSVFLMHCPWPCLDGNRRTHTDTHKQNLLLATLHLWSPRCFQHVQRERHTFSQSVKWECCS